jgi:probable phosphoglycerate mutase
VAVFSHGHFLRVLAARWLTYSPQEGARFALDTACISVLGYEHAVAAILLWNDAGHLGGDRRHD